MTENHSAEDSVTDWIFRLKDNDSDAAQNLWDRYLQHLIHLASRKLRDSSKRTSDEDDIVAEVFNDFLQGVAQSRFRQLHDRNDLWQVLAMLTDRKVISRKRREGAAKRGANRTRGESVFRKRGDDGDMSPGIAIVPGRDDDPAMAAEFADTLSHLLKLLSDPVLQAIARDQLAGFSQQEIAERNQISIPTVQRKLRLIRDKWNQELSDECT